MNTNSYQEMTNEELIKKRNLIKSVSIGFGIIYILAIAVLIYLFASKGFKNVNIATLIPVFSLPITFLPLLISFGSIKKEIKARNL